VTLLELLIVLMILSLILTAAVKTWDVTLERGRFESTRKRLEQLATAITGDPNYVVNGRRVDFGFVGDMGRLPNSLKELVVAPAVSPPESSRWKGPYLRATFSESPETYRTDGWGDTIAYKTDSMFLRSYAGRGLADRTRWMTQYLGFSRNELLSDTVEGRVVDVHGAPPPPNDTILSSLRVVLYRPFEGLPHADTLHGTQLNNGAFTFPFVSQGTDRLRAYYIRFAPPPPETIAQVTADVTVYPRIGARDVQLRLNLDWNSLP
jgi:type II secretory pathway pseudopilin PulG